MVNFVAGRKTKIETVLGDGSKISIVINGNDFSKIKKFIALLEMLENNDEMIELNPQTSPTSIYDRIYDLVRFEFGRASFDLNDLHRAYLLKYNDEIKKSTLATYLSRMVENGILERFGSRGRYRYRYIEIVSSKPRIY